MKNTIIHLTDFSDCANNSLNFAIILAKVLKCKLEIIHLLDIHDLNNHERKPNRVIDELKLLEKEAQNNLSKIEEEVQKYEVAFATSIYLGRIKDLIPKHLALYSPEFIVMGTTGANSLTNKLMGSNTHAVIKEAGVPVIAIPEKARITEFKKITFLSNYRDKDIHAIGFISKIAANYNGTIDVTHILNDEESNRINNQKLMDNFRESVEDNIAYKNIEYKLLYSDDAFNRIQILIKETSPDFIALVMRNQSFLERLFFGSLTEKMVYHSDIPILVFPEET